MFEPPAQHSVTLSHPFLLGILFSGNLYKKNPYGKAFRNRFVILTKDNVHWFKKVTDDDLCGQHRGQISLEDVLTVRILDENKSTFEIQASNFTKKYFRASSENECEEWVSSLKSAINIRIKSALKEKHVLSDDTSHDTTITTDQLTILLVAFRSSIKNAEILLCRNPDWQRMIFLPSIGVGDEVQITLSNGGTATVSYNTIQDKSYSGKPFDCVVNNTTLPYILTLSICKEHTKNADKKWALNKLNKFYLFDLNDNVTIQSLLITIMVVVVGLRSLYRVIIAEESTTHYILVFVLSILLALHTIYLVYRPLLQNSDFLKHKKIDENFVMRIISFHVASLDDDDDDDGPRRKDPDDEIPQRFINGCEGDIGEARRRWDITRAWRADEKIDQLLVEKQPHFFDIKKIYPHYVCGHGKEGNCVYYERPDEIDIGRLKEKNISLDAVLRHWLFVTEFQWAFTAPEPLAKSIAVIDICNLSMSQVGGEVLEFVRASVTIANQHYPERAHVVYLVNVPRWFSWLWGLIKPLVHPNTQRKVKILSKNQILPGLLEHIDLDQIPVYYGGGNDMGGFDACRFESAEERRLYDYVRALNKAIDNGQQPETKEDVVKLLDSANRNVKQNTNIHTATSNSVVSSASNGFKSQVQVKGNGNSDVTRMRSPSSVKLLFGSLNDTDNQSVSSIGMDSPIKSFARKR